MDVELVAISPNQGLVHIMLNLGEGKLTWNASCNMQKVIPNLQSL